MLHYRITPGHQHFIQGYTEQKGAIDTSCSEPLAIKFYGPDFTVARNQAVNCVIKPCPSLNRRSIDSYSVDSPPGYELVLNINRSSRDKSSWCLENDNLHSTLSLGKNNKRQLIVDTIVTGYVPNEQELTQAKHLVAELKKNETACEVLIEQKFYDEVNPFQIFDVVLNGSDLLLAGNFNYHQDVIHCGECSFSINVDVIKNRYSTANAFTDACLVHRPAASGDNAAQHNQYRESLTDLNLSDTKKNILSAIKQRHYVFATERFGHDSSSVPCLSKGNEDGDYEYTAAQEWSSVLGCWQPLPVYRKFDENTGSFPTNKFVLKPSMADADLNYQYVSGFEPAMNMMEKYFNEELCRSENSIDIKARLELLKAIRPHIPELYKEVNAKKIGMRSYSSKSECEKLLKKILTEINRQDPCVANKGLFFLLFPDNGKDDSYLSTEFQKMKKISEESKDKMEPVEYFISVLSEKILQPLMHDVFKECFDELGAEIHSKVFMMACLANAESPSKK